MKGKKHHGKRADGGRIGMKVSGNPDVFKEAEEKKKGGKVGKHVGKAEGSAAKHRMDRPGRKKGGRVGANAAPLSTAHTASSPDKYPKSQEGGASD